MVAAGATILMAVSEENSSNETENRTARPTNQSACFRYSGVQHYRHRNTESSSKGDVATCSSNITEKKHRSLITEKNGKVISKVEPKESSKSLTPPKTTQIRETRTSRLRAASIILPSGATLVSKRMPGSETTGSQKYNSASIKEESTTSLNGIAVNPIKERDKSYKRKPYLNRSRHIEAAPIDCSNEIEFNERRSRRQSIKRSQVSEIVSSSTDAWSNRQVTSPRRKYTDSKMTGNQCNTIKNSSKPCSSSASATSAKRSIVQQSSNGVNDSEVSRRVDALTALTRATMERVERLASTTTTCTNHSIENVPTVEKISMSPRRCIVSKHTPVSILKHKTMDGEGCDRQSQASLGNSSHVPSPVTFSPSVTETVSHKRHGILKKRSSLDENEILRRRSCSPDVSFIDSTYSEFRPILKNQRRSSLDEIVKRDQSPDQQQPASILKRKSSREDDREIYRSSLGSPEPQSILKRKLANSVRTNSISHHHVTIASDVANANMGGCSSTSANACSDNLEGTEVRPILKKKYGREELAGGDVSSLEPRPILKKKSSTESDEHEHDKPKKTILKSSRKNSYEEGGYETESTSPRKLSALKNRAIEIENVRPILKQSGSCRHQNDTRDLSADLFLRKRAQSVGHARIADSNCVESIRVLAKRRSLESSSPSDMLRIPTSTRRCFVAERSKENLHMANSSGLIKENKLCEKPAKVKQIGTNGMEEKNKTDSHVYFAKLGTDVVNRETIEVFAGNEKESVARRNEEQVNAQGTCENYAGVHRSNSVSKMTQHFKTLQEKASAVAAVENSSQRPQKLSRGVQRYRERKMQSGERFNTQPVTFQEVREAVLQNQRNAVVLNDMGMSNDDSEPSKLSLAERVRFFNQKIVTTETALPNATPQEKQRRRPVARYKTQPVTTEEVEVATRISILNTDPKFHTVIGGHSKECQRLHSLSSQHDLPKSILKSSTNYTHNLSRAKSPELRGMKLIRSMLKRESEESSEQLAILPSSSEMHPRSILKSNPHPKSVSQNVSVDATISTEESINVENQNLNSGTAKNFEKLDSSIIETTLARHVPHHLYDNVRTTTSKVDDVIKHEVEMLSHNTAVSQHEKILSDVVDDSKSETLLNLISERRNHTRYGDLLKNKTNRVSDEDYGNDSDKGDNKKDTHKKREKDEEETDVGNDNDDDHASMSYIQEANNITITKEEETSGTAQYSANVLTKSVSQHALDNERRKQQHGLPLQGLCRSATQVIASIETSEMPSISIADRLAALRHSGNTNWKRRVVGNNDGESCYDLLNSEESTTIKSGVLADCIGKLESSAEDWRRRIIMPDAINFTVAGKMKIADQSNDANSSFLTDIAANSLNQKKKTPRPQRFKMRKNRECTNDAVSTPTSPCKDLSPTTRISYSEPVSDDSDEECNVEHAISPTVSIPKTDDETFTSFFSGVSLEKCEVECFDLDKIDFDIIAPQSELLVQKRSIQTQRRRITSRNPLKTLAARTDLKSEYTEIRTNVTAKTIKSSNLEKLAKSSSFAVEALAGLASVEDFSSVILRNVAETSVSTNKLQPYKDIMLILIKGRRHVQARLIEPIAESINSGDNYILVTKTEIFNYVGKYSNIIEKTRAAEIASCIQQQKDLGCQATQVITINDDKPVCTWSQVQKFWSYLGVLDSDKLNVIKAGHPDEDELYESAIIDTNMVYELKDTQLVPYEKFWGILPRIEMLDKNKILVFDFGAEMYIWNGKGVSAEKKKLATQLTMELWNDGYDYSECTACPMNAARMIGIRNGDSCASPLAKSAKSRPEWCLLAKLTQHVETILFREKFLDWPNVAGVIKARGRKSDMRPIDSTVTVHLDDSDDVWLPNTTPVDLILEGCHLGRGIGFYDNELKKEYIITTTSLMVWHIDEFSHTLLERSSIGQFYSGDSYIIQWTYSVMITGRELSGLPSKHSAKGRDRSVYFIWQGRHASLNEQGAAALLTVELDSDRGPQIRIIQGHEPAAFLNLFSGRMVVHDGKRSEKKNDKRWRLYISRGTLEFETSLVEIPFSTRHLRSRGSFVLLDIENTKAYVWHGKNSLRHIKENAMKAASKLKDNRPEEAGLSSKDNMYIYEIQEGLESEEFKNALGGVNKKLYWSSKTTQIQDYTPRLYHLSTISKNFRATEILCPHRADLATPFPFLQDELYQANQPALFLLDDNDVIWIWQGWWPDDGMEDQSGSKTIRWQAERRAAMTIAIRYWRNTRNVQTTNLPIYLVWAGLEPLQFINLFPEWAYRDDIAELNMEDGRNPGEILTAENELARLTQSTYLPAQLLQRPLPDGVDPTHLELYLSQQHFQELLGMSKEDFQQLPVWKQVNLKKEIGLF